MDNSDIRLWEYDYYVARVEAVECSCEIVTMSVASREDAQNMAARDVHGLSVLRVMKR